jgi:hypothetical protein
VKFLLEWDIKPKHRQEAVKAVSKFKQPKEMKTLFPAHNCVASNRGLAVVEVDDIMIIQKAFDPILDFVSFKVTPVIPVFPESD